VVASWVVFRLKNDGRQCWGVRKLGRDPWTQEYKNTKGTNVHV
jgi:hypothetical protein